LRQHEGGKMVSRIAALRDIFAADRKAATALEYGLIASMIAVALVMSVDMLGHHLLRAFDVIAAGL
jgi:Flp pilus assembly pilin Flp